MSRTPGDSNRRTLSEQLRQMIAPCGPQRAIRFSSDSDFFFGSGLTRAVVPSVRDPPITVPPITVPPRPDTRVGLGPRIRAGGGGSGVSVSTRFTSLDRRPTRYSLRRRPRRGASRPGATRRPGRRFRTRRSTPAGFAMNLTFLTLMHSYAVIAANMSSMPIGNAGRDGVMVTSPNRPSHDRSAYGEASGSPMIMPRTVLRSARRLQRRQSADVHDRLRTWYGGGRRSDDRSWPTNRPASRVAGGYPHRPVRSLR